MCEGRVMLKSDWRPPYAYIPGETPRHAEALFGSLKEDIATVPYYSLDATQAWAFGMVFFEEGYFWECHEIFEAIWMACPPNAPEKLYVQSIIQRANAGLKRKMKRESAAQKLEVHADQLEAEAKSRKKGVFSKCERLTLPGG